MIKSGGRCACGLFHHSVLHHFVILVLGPLGGGCPAPGNLWFCGLFRVVAWQCRFTASRGRVRGIGYRPALRNFQPVALP